MYKNSHGIKFMLLILHLLRTWTLIDTLPKSVFGAAVVCTNYSQLVVIGAMIKENEHEVHTNKVWIGSFL